MSIQESNENVSETIQDVQEAINVADLEVSLLLADIKEAKLVSDHLRKLGIYAHYYKSLFDFWTDCKHKKPDLLIIDVKKMSEGNTLFQNHSRVKSAELNFAFYYSDSTKVLLHSTRSLPALALIHRDGELDIQLKATLFQLKKYKESKENNKDILKEMNRLQVEQKSLRSEMESTQALLLERKQVEELSHKLANSKSHDEYLLKLVEAFSNWDQCEEFSLYALAENGHKLSSPRFIKNKYRLLPDLWLPDGIELGITRNEQEMAFEVANDIYAESMKSLFVYSSHKYPDIMIFGNFSQTLSAEFPWENLSQQLSFHLLRAAIETKKSKESAPEKTRELSSAQAFDLLDEMHFELTHQDYKAYEINVSSLIKTICDSGQHRFYWRAFENHFLSQLALLLGEESSYSVIAPAKFVLFIPAQQTKEVLAKVNGYCGKFPYWRFFQDPSLVLGSNFDAQVTLISKNSFQFLYREAAPPLTIKSYDSERARLSGPI